MNPIIMAVICSILCLKRSCPKCKRDQVVPASKRRESFANALENNRQLSIQIEGERVHVPVRASISIEHQRGIEEEEIEFQLKRKYNRKSSIKQ